jgi:DNA-binding LacI/PurR family transcriptional regulator
MKKLTIKDIAKMAEVYHTTLSRARNGAQCLYF